MTTKITLNGVEYDLDTTLAERAGYLKKTHQPITKIFVGDVFKSPSVSYLLLVSDYLGQHWNLVGNGGLAPYSNQQNVSKQEIIDYLNLNKCYLVKNINEAVSDLIYQ